MRHVAAVAGLLALGFGWTGSAQESTDKQLLRNRFTKGEKLTMKLVQKMNLKLEQIPEQFKEMLGNEPLKLEISGVLDVQVKSVGEDGTAVLEGKFKTLDAKGNVFVNDVDYHYDASKPPEKQPDPQDDPATPYGIDPVGMLRQLATQVVTVKVGELGKIEVEGNFGQTGGIVTQLFSLNGLMGALPKEKVGAGDKWTATDGMTIPGAQFKIGIKSENTVDKFLKVKDEEVAVVKTKATVTTSSDESDQGSMFNLKATMTGGGEGTAFFSVTRGRAKSSENELKVKISATMDDPQGGNPIEFKAVLDRSQKMEIVE